MATSPVLNREYAGETSTLRAARRDVVDWLLECGSDAETVERASLITSELASNAVQASPGQPYQLEVYLVGGSVSLSICNQAGKGRPPPRESWRPVDGLALRGRGLSIVDSLSDEVIVDVDDDRVIVTSRFRLVDQ